MNFIDVYGGYVYVATGKNGLLKVGFTGNVLNRIAGLEYDPSTGVFTWAKAQPGCTI